MMTRVVLLGAGGFLGTHARRALGDAVGPADVVCVGRRSPGAGGTPWRALDLVAANPADYRRLLSEPAADVVVNCAGALAGPACLLAEVNIGVVAKLVDAARDLAWPGRIVQLGSAAEYGRATPGIPLSEDSPPRPASHYGVTKLAATQLLTLGAPLGAFEAVVLRVFNPVGAGTGAGTVLGRAAREIRGSPEHGKACITLGSLDASRDFVDAHDVARAVALSACLPRRCNGIFNIAGGTAVQVRHAVRLLAETAEFTGEILETITSSPRSDNVDWQQADICRARMVLGWSPSVDLACSVRALWEESVDRFTTATDAAVRGRAPREENLGRSPQ